MTVTTAVMKRRKTNQQQLKQLAHQRQLPRRKSLHQMTMTLQTRKRRSQFLTLPPRKRSPRRQRRMSPQMTIAVMKKKKTRRSQLPKRPRRRSRLTMMTRTAMRMKKKTRLQQKRRRQRSQSLWKKTNP